MTVIPECADLPVAICLGRDVPREEFVDRVVTEGQEYWRVLGRCRGCGQAWLIEAPDTRSSGLAIKIPDPTRWTQADERAARVAYLRRVRGGDAAAGECIVAGCTRRPVMGIAYCAEHDLELNGTPC